MKITIKYTILVIWKNIEYNIGNAFDGAKGTFTSPHDGIYSFYATALVSSGKHSEVFIRVNGSRKVHHLVSPGYANASPNGVFKLKKGDTVNIEMVSYFHYANSECLRTYFQGHLIDLL